MSPSEIAFLALGLVLGAAIGAAIVEAVRSRPAPRREVRVTITPNSIVPRRASTLAMAVAAAPSLPVPGSPVDASWPEAPWPSPAGVRQAAAGDGGAAGHARTRVPSGPADLVPASAVAVPIEGGAGRHTGSAAPRTGPVAVLAPDGRAIAPAAAATAVAVLDRPGAAATEPAALAPDEDTRVAVRAWTVDHDTPVTIPDTAIAFVVEPGSNDPMAAAGDPAPGGPAPAVPPGGATGSAAADPSADPCGSIRQLMEERCAVASASREQAQAAADALREAQRAYDALRERIERAQADADPREIAAAKDRLHREFRAATAIGIDAEATEAAAREWLTRINEINTRARDAARIVDQGSAELRSAMPRLDRLGVEADAARISAETADAACRDARERLAACEEARATRRLAPAPPEEPAPIPGGGWPDEPSSPLVPTQAAVEAALLGVPAIIRILHGDRTVRERVVAAMSEDSEASRAWHLRLAALVDAISARAIEDGYLDMPGDDPFWGLFSASESREIVGALSALGFRFDGMGGFADERVPAPRDLSLAVGYAGLDRMRIRNWPREADLPTLFARASIAGDEWLAHEAGDLSLGEMVDALGSRAGELADVWNSWGRLRPLLLATD